MFKKALYASAAVLMSASLAFAADIGKPAPDFKATDIAGKAQSLSQYKGKTVVLEWNNPDCPFVRKHYDTQNMQKLQEYAASKGVVWLSINSGAKGKQGNMTPEAAAETLSENKAKPSAYIIDESGAIGHLYEAKTTPHMFVIDAKGTLVYKGAIDDKASANHDDVEGANNYVRAAIDALAAGKTPEVTDTKSYGCSVKY